MKPTYTPEEITKAKKIMAWLGGLKGGPARRDKMTAEERKEHSNKMHEAKKKKALEKQIREG